MKKTLIAFAMASAALASTAHAADRYKIDTEGAHASVNFEVPHLGFSYIVGRFNNFEGEFTFDKGNPGNSSVEVTVKTESVDTNHPERNNHVRSNDFLGASEFGEAKFKSTSIEVVDDHTANIKGDLTIRDVTKEVVINAVHIGGGNDPWGNYREGFRGTTEFSLKDFGAPSPMADLKVKLDLNFEGIKQ